MSSSSTEAEFWANSASRTKKMVEAMNPLNIFTKRPNVIDQMKYHLGLMSLSPSRSPKIHKAKARAKVQDEAYPIILAGPPPNEPDGIKFIRIGPARLNAANIGKDGLRRERRLERLPSVNQIFGTM